MLIPLRHVASLFPRLWRVRASPYTVAAAEALDLWASQKKDITLSETLHTDRISDLYATLPTRDGTRHPYKSPKNSEALGFGHHLAFFHPRTPEKHLRPDGTDADFCPPEPFVRRMWAGGRIEWRKSLVIGGKATACMTVRSVVKKGFGGVDPMVFVNQDIEISNEGDKEYAVLEERTHVYLALGVNQRRFRQGKSAGASCVYAVSNQTVPLYTVLGLPQPDFSLEFTPSPTTLFRFSALTFNGHRIHLDRDYARESEGYPGKSTTTVSESQIAFFTGYYRTSRAWATHGPDVARNSRAPLPRSTDKKLRISSAEPCCCQRGVDLQRNLEWFERDSTLGTERSWGGGIERKGVA